MEQYSRNSLEWVIKLISTDEPDVEIKNIEEEPGSGRGDNYTSMLYRVRAKGRKQINKEEWIPWQRAIIYKVLPQSKARREAYKSELLFRNEVVFYKYVWPALNKLQEDGKTVFQGVAKVLAARPDFIAMEDLKERGYRMADRRTGLQLERLKVVLKALAGFHALSLTLKELRPEVFERLSNPDEGQGIQEVLFRSENEDWYRQYYRMATKNAIRMVAEGLPEDLEHRREEALEKFQSFLSEDTFFRTMCKLTAANGPLSVFCHGDCWTNNFLFRDSSVATTETQDVYLVDFQVSRVGSLALDLVNLLYCCSTSEVRKNHKVELLQHYHSHLMSALKTLNPKGPQRDSKAMWDLLNEELRRCGRFGLGLAVDILPISTCESDQAPDLYEDGEENKDVRTAIVLPSGGAECSRLMTELVLELIDNHAL